MSLNIYIRLKIVDFGKQATTVKIWIWRKMEMVKRVVGVRKKGVLIRLKK